MLNCLHCTSHCTKLWFIHSFSFLFGPDPDSQIYADLDPKPWLFHSRKNSLLTLCACVLRRKVCRGLEVATAKGTPCDTRWRISQQSKRNRSKYNLNTSYFKINARYEVCVDSLHGLLIEQFELPESRKKISRKKKKLQHIMQTERFMYCPMIWPSFMVWSSWKALYFIRWLIFLLINWLEPKFSLSAPGRSLQWGKLFS